MFTNRRLRVLEKSEEIPVGVHAPAPALSSSSSSSSSRASSSSSVSSWRQAATGFYWNTERYLPEQHQAELLVLETLAKSYNEQHPGHEFYCDKMSLLSKTKTAESISLFNEYLRSANAGMCVTRAYRKQRMDAEITGFVFSFKVNNPHQFERKLAEIKSESRSEKIEKIKVYLNNQNFESGMELTRKLLKEDLDSPDGGLPMCQYLVFLYSSRKRWREVEHLCGIALSYIEKSEERSSFRQYFTDLKKEAGRILNEALALHELLAKKDSSSSTSAHRKRKLNDPPSRGIKNSRNSDFFSSSPETGSSSSGSSSFVPPSPTSSR